MKRCSACARAIPCRLDLAGCAFFASWCRGQGGKWRGRLSGHSATRWCLPRIRVNPDEKQAFAALRMTMDRGVCNRSFKRDGSECLQSNFLQGNETTRFNTGVPASEVAERADIRKREAKAELVLVAD